MDLTGEHVLPLAREQVYDALLDPATLQAALPGCESVAADEDGAYRVAVVTAIGPVKARFKGVLRIDDPRRPEGYVMRFEGDGGVAGFARGSATVTLDALAPQQTRLRYVAQAQIGGKLAAIGARLIDATAARLSTQFFERLAQLLSASASTAGNVSDAGDARSTSGAEDGGAFAAARTAKTAGAASAASASHANTPSPRAASTATTQASPATGTMTGATPSITPPPPSPPPAHGMVTIQMPAWTWALTVAVLAALAAWLGTR